LIQVDHVLGNLKTKFEELSHQILHKMDQMGSRMDELEKSLQNLLEASEEKE
jgi:septation ring formation regulator EzrA